MSSSARSLDGGIADPEVFFYRTGACMFGELVNPETNCLKWTQAALEVRTRVAHR